MKKVLLSLLAVAALVLSCQNYDDEFAALNAKVATLEGQLGSLASIQTAVNSLQSAVSAIPGLAAELASIQAAIDAAATAADIEALQAELNSLIAANASALESQGLDLDAILGTVSTYEGNITIDDAASLAFAKSLGRKVRNIKGNVSIDVTGDITSAQVAEVSDLIVSVIGNVTLTNNAAIAETPISVSSLESIKGNYSVAGWDAVDDKLTTITGTLTTNYGQAVLFPNLTSVGGAIDIKNVAAAAATATTKAITGVTAVNLVNVIGGAATTITTDAGNTEALSLPLATSVKIGDIEVDALTADLATEVELHFDGTIADGLDLDTDKAATIVALAKVITGAIDVDQLATGSISLPNVTTFGNASSFTGVSFSAPKLATITGNMDANVVPSLSLPAAATSGGTISATAATVFDAPKLVAGGAVSIKAGGEMTLASAAAADLGTLATLTSLTLTDQNEAVDLSAGVELTSVSITGKANTSDVTIGEQATKLASLSFEGKNGNIVLGTDNTDGLEKLVTFSTSGTISSLAVYNAVALESISMAHTNDADEGTAFILQSNDKLTTFKTSFDRVHHLDVSDNLGLVSFDASSITAAPNNLGADTVYVGVLGNDGGAQADIADATGLIGTYQALDANNDEAFMQSSLKTLAPFITATLTSGQLVAAAGVDNDADGDFFAGLDYLVQTAAGAGVVLATDAGNDKILTAAEVAAIK